MPATDPFTDEGVNQVFPFKVQPGEKDGYLKVQKNLEHSARILMRGKQEGDIPVWDPVRNRYVPGPGSAGVWVRQWVLDADGPTFDLSGWPDTTVSLELSYRLQMAVGYPASLGQFRINDDYEDLENDYFWRLVPHDPASYLTTQDRDVNSYDEGGAFGVIQAYDDVPQGYDTGSLWFPGANADGDYDYPIGYHGVGQTCLGTYQPDSFNVAGFPQRSGPIERLVLFASELNSIDDYTRQYFRIGSRVIIKAYSETA